jgi:hypothetical protein
MKLLERLREIGPAVWLFLLYQNNAEHTGDPIWALVVEGKTVTDVHVAGVLGVSLYTAIRWRRRLESVSIIKTEAVRGGGFRIWLRHSDTAAESAPAAEHWPEMQTTALQ